MITTGEGQKSSTARRKLCVADSSTSNVEVGYLVFVLYMIINDATGHELVIWPPMATLCGSQINTDIGL